MIGFADLDIFRPSTLPVGYENPMGTIRLKVGVGKTYDSDLAFLKHHIDMF